MPSDEQCEGNIPPTVQYVADVLCFFLGGGEVKNSDHKLDGKEQLSATKVSASISVKSKSAG